MLVGIYVQETCRLRDNQRAISGNLRMSGFLGISVPSFLLLFFSDINTALVELTILKAMF